MTNLPVYIVVDKDRWFKLWIEVVKHGTKEEITEFTRLYTTQMPHP